MAQIELTIEDIKLEQDRAKARERMRVRRAADPDGVRAYNRAWRTANPEKVKASHDAWKITNGEEHKARRKESARRWRAENPGSSSAWRKANPEKADAWYKANVEKIKFQVKRAALKRIYGLTPEQRDELFAKQGSCCGICKSTEPGSTKGWHIDHCHDTKCVRGILCNHCNLMLGYAKDNRTTLADAIEYLCEAGGQRQ